MRPQDEHQRSAAESSEAAAHSADAPRGGAALAGSGSPQRLLAELQSLLQALAALAHSELRLSLALLVRAVVLAVLGLGLLLLAALLATGLLLATALALGLSWPAALAASLGLLLLATWICARVAAGYLNQCGLPRTRAQLHALWPETAP